MSRPSRRTRAVAAAAAAALAAGTALAVSATGAVASPDRPSAHGCDLGGGVKHVIEITFDNVHFFRDNPNVPSDLELMPHLKQFLERNGSLLSDVHTPLIAHTADDSLTIYTGLYGDRHGMPVSNSYKTYRPDGTTESDGSFVYWTSPVYNSAANAVSGTEPTTPSMVYSPTVPAKPGATGTITPAPWVPFTRAGCSVGDFSTANMVLENTNLDIPTVFGADSPEAQQNAADPDTYKNVEAAQYTGEAVHCARTDNACNSAQRAVADQLPTEPGGYQGYRALFGYRYVGPLVTGGKANLVRNGYQVTDANGDLVDLDGNTIKSTYANIAGFPGFSPTASQSLAYLASMQEAGVPVTYGYISDIHEKKAGQTGCTTASATGTGYPVGPGDPCSIATAKAYDDAFAKFFDRLAKDGITPANTEFVITSEENDHLAGANTLRASKPSPADCDGVTVACHYAAGQIGELQANLPGLLASERGNSTPFAVEPQGAAMYANGRPAPTDPALRQLERDTAALTGDNPYTGATGEKIVNYQAGAVEQRILHMQTADPLRTPSYTIFPKPDYYFDPAFPKCTASTNPAAECVSQYARYAYNHGYYSPDIDITWAGFAGPGVARKGIVGADPRHGPTATADGQNGSPTLTVPQAGKVSTWAEETDIRPTLLSLVGLRDDYLSDGTPLSFILSRHKGDERLDELAATYRQLNSSVGAFATDTLKADTIALASSSAGDQTYNRIESKLTGLADQRDALAQQIKMTLDQGRFGNGHVDRATVAAQLARGKRLLEQAHELLDS
ncbi:alkaline phosphatase family protein [Planosporangium thailandense]|uniref:Alkaline phosphatase family protein n=1 Tax=Planosporangium thailandense TaxID=765197 RepID=A0ABX0XT73_9ACTN|nr:alkaline phosphatase family protein [Planosporangium thailandense]NJC68650.1 alkaline phosphatase family protein [Planosporangium thailandense]